MNKKILFGIVLMLLLSFSFASAGTIDDFERSVSSGWGTATNGETYVLTNDGSPNSFDVGNTFSGAGYLYTDSSSSRATYNLDISSADKSGFSFEFRHQTAGSGANMFMVFAGATRCIWVNIDNAGSGSQVLRTYTGSGWQNHRVVNQNTWYVVNLMNVNWVSETFDIYVDGVLETSGAQMDGSCIEANVDEVEGQAIQGSLAFEYICDGSSCGASAGANVTLTVVDEWNSSTPVNNVSATINGDTFTNTTGNVLYTDIVVNASQTYDIELSAQDYFDKTYSSSTMESKTLSMFQSEISFQLYSKVTNSSVVANYTIGGMQNTTFHLDEGEHTVLVEPSGVYFPFNYTFNVTPLQNETLNIFEAHDALVTVNLNDAVLGTPIVNATNLTLSYGNWSETFASPNGTFNLELEQLSYDYVATNIQYAQNNGTLTVDETPEEINISMYAANSVWVTAQDFDTGAALTNFTVEIYDSNTSYTASDNGTGTVRLNNISSGTYTVAVTKDSYSTAEYVLTMTAGSHQNLIAYLSQSDTTTIFNIVDIISTSIIEGAQVSMYRTINSSWVLVTSKESDITGRLQLTYTPNVEYRFVVDADTYNQREFLLEPIFDSYTIRMTPSAETEPDLVSGLFVYSINNSGRFYEDANNSFSIAITSGTGTLEYYTLNVYTPNGTLYQEQCFNSYGCTDSFLFEIVDSGINDSVRVEYVVKETGREEKTFTKLYAVQLSPDGDVLSNWADADADDLERALVAVVLLLVFGGAIATGASLVGAPILTSTGLVLTVVSGLVAFTGFMPMSLFWMIALASLLIIIFGRGQI